MRNSISYCIPSKSSSAGTKTTVVSVGSSRNPAFQRATCDDGFEAFCMYKFLAMSDFLAERVASSCVYWSCCKTHCRPIGHMGGVARLKPFRRRNCLEEDDVVSRRGGATWSYSRGPTRPLPASSSCSPAPSCPCPWPPSPHPYVVTAHRQQPGNALHHQHKPPPRRPDIILDILDTIVPGNVPAIRYQFQQSVRCQGYSQALHSHQFNKVEAVQHGLILEALNRKVPSRSPGTIIYAPTAASFQSCS